MNVFLLLKVNEEGRPQYLTSEGGWGSVFEAALFDEEGADQFPLLERVEVSFDETL